MDNNIEDASYFGWRKFQEHRTDCIHCGHDGLEHFVQLYNGYSSVAWVKCGICAEENHVPQSVCFRGNLKELERPYDAYAGGR